MTDIVFTTSGLSISQKSKLAARLCQGLQLSLGNLPGPPRPYISLERGQVAIVNIDHAPSQTLSSLLIKAESIRKEFMVLTESDEGQEVI